MNPAWPSRIATLLLTLALAAPLQAAGTEPQRPNWDRELAQQVARVSQDDDALGEWFRLLREGDSGALLQAVTAFGASRAESEPARESRLYELALGMANFPPDQLPVQLVDYLAAYTPQTLVAHEENPAIAVPLFNIPAAAQGLRNARQRLQGENRSVMLLQQAPGQWLNAYRAASRVERQGFIDALDAAAGTEVAAVGNLALQLLGEAPELLAVAGQAAMRAADPEALQLALSAGRGAEAADLLRQAAQRLSENDRALLLLGLIRSAPAEQAALAIALLAPGLALVPEVTATLFDLLGDEALGASAALALSRHPDPSVAGQLQELARQQGIDSNRARMALDWSESPE